MVVVDGQDFISARQEECKDDMGAYDASVSLLWVSTADCGGPHQCIQLLQ